MPKGFNSIAKGVERAVTLIAAVGAGIVVVGLVIVVYGTFMRYVLHRAEAWTVELPAMLLLPFIVFGLGYAQLTGSHLKVDLIVRYLPAKVRHIAYLLSRLIYVVYIAAICAALWNIELYWIAHLSVTPDARLPLYLIGIALLVGTVTFGLLVLVEFARGVAKETNDTVQHKTK